LVQIGPVVSEEKIFQKDYKQMDDGHQVTAMAYMILWVIR
jgi:hypothetical protein